MLLRSYKLNCFTCMDALVVDLQLYTCFFNYFAKYGCVSVCDNVLYNIVCFLFLTLSCFFLICN